MSLTPLMGQNSLEKAALRAVLEHGRQKRQWEEGQPVPVRALRYVVTDVTVFQPRLQPYQPARATVKLALFVESEATCELCDPAHRLFRSSLIQRILYYIFFIANLGGAEWEPT